MNATDKGHASVVDPNMASQVGNTALIFGAIKGHAPVVTLRLADGRVDPDLTNQYGRTAITCASLNRHDSVVKLLLADDAVWIN